MKYGSRTCYGSKVVVKVKVFFVQTCADRRADMQTGQKLDAHRIGDSGGIKSMGKYFKYRQFDLNI